MMNLSMYLVDTPVRDTLVGDAPPRDAPDGDRYSIETSAYWIRLTIAQEQLWKIGIILKA